jgi:hypothetical protein
MLDPVTAPRFKLSLSHKIATAGSCFAQHISRRISELGFNYFVTERGDHLSAEDRVRLNYGVFSARFGNIYTARQLLQLFEEALGNGPPRSEAWLRSDGRYVDAFRPAICPEGYSSPEEVANERSEHLQHVRQLFQECEILIFTLGLTEGWTNVASGDVYPLPPGVAGGEFKESEHGFVNFTISDVVSDLSFFLAKLKIANPSVQVLLTVSPVPLIATYENRHVLVSTTYSKSVLRVAAEEMVRQFEWVDYFPSYELITGNFNLGRYYEDDLRQVNRMGISHAMRCFVGNYLDGGDLKTAVATDIDSDSDSPAAPQFGVRSVVCDEDLIERVAAFSRNGS